MFLCQELADTRPQDGATVRSAAVWRPATTFQLHFPASIIDKDLKHGNCTTITISVTGLKRTLLSVFGAKN